MLSLETFTRALETIESYEEKEQELSELLNTEGFTTFTSEYATLVVDMLEEAFADVDGWISFWLWECNLGKETEGKAFYPNGASIDISSPEKLYALVTGFKQ